MGTTVRTAPLNYLNMSAAQCAERLAQAFADINQEFPALNPEELPSRIQNILKGEPNPFCNLSEASPYISRQMVTVLKVGSLETSPQS